MIRRWLSTLWQTWRSFQKCLQVLNHRSSLWAQHCLDINLSHVYESLWSLRHNRDHRAMLHIVERMREDLDVTSTLEPTPARPHHTKLHTDRSLPPTPKNQGFLKPTSVNHDICLDSPRSRPSERCYGLGGSVKLGTIATQDYEPQKSPQHEKVTEASASMDRSPSKASQVLGQDVAAANSDCTMVVSAENILDTAGRSPTVKGVTVKRRFSDTGQHHDSADLRARRHHAAKDRVVSKALPPLPAAAGEWWPGKYASRFSDPVTASAYHCIAKDLASPSQPDEDGVIFASAFDSDSDDEVTERRVGARARLNEWLGRRRSSCYGSADGFARFAFATREPRRVRLGSECDKRKG